MIRNQDKLRGNPRLGMSYRTLARMGEDKAKAVKADSQRFFKALDNGELI